VRSSKLLLLAAVAVPLWLSTRDLIREEKIHQAFDGLRRLESGNENVEIELRKLYRAGGELRAEILVLLPPRFDEEKRKAIVEEIRRRTGPDLRLLVDYRYRY
jgi:hypothetical protein